MSFFFFSPLPGGPNQVREYLTQILIANHGAPSTLAANIANGWQLGRFSDLHETTRYDFENIFGSEVGKLFYRRVQEDLANEFYASPVGVFNYWATVFAIVMGTFFFGRAFYSSSDERKMAYVLRATFVLGPPMILLAFQHRYGLVHLSPVRLLIGGFACTVGFALYGILRDRQSERSEMQGRRLDEDSKKK
jgi:hypothetical protein